MTHSGLGSFASASQLDDGTWRLQWEVGPAGRITAELPRTGAVLLRATTDDGASVERHAMSHEGVIATAVETLLRMLGVPQESGADLRARQIAREIVEAAD